MSANDGGPAFPRAGTDTSYSQEGMSLRDWFAGQALAGMLAGFSKGERDGGPARFHEGNCDTAYQIADAMLRAREGGAR